MLSSTAAHELFKNVPGIGLQSQHRIGDFRRHYEKDDWRSHFIVDVSLYLSNQKLVVDSFSAN